MTPMSRIAPAACAAILAATLARAALAAPGDAPQKANVPAELRNVRYCEILTMTRHRLAFDIKVYNTLGQNFCPEDQWRKLDAKALAKELNVSRVNLNGPRYWTIDAIKASGETAAGETRDFGGIAMTRRATLRLRLWQAKQGGYRVNTIRRNTAYLFKAGKPVYELVSPKGDVYMMQSYSQIVDPKLSIDDLPNLGARLKLPKGWKFQTRVLDADYTLKAEGTAYLVQDDLFNSYQRRGK
ncbi:MAG TPA: hypothetical protein VHC71_01020 [Hyphomicrobium sp.]|nr:hypothetical protein [Hyphomicrobium sp.]